MISRRFKIGGLAAALLYAAVALATTFVNVQVNDGSLATPAFGFNSDTDTGWRRTGSGTVAYVANGADAVTFSSTGCAGCVTATNPVNLATQVTGNLPVSNLNGGSGASATSFWTGNGTWTTPAAGGATYKFKAADTSRATNATPSADPDLVFTGMAAGTYAVQASISVFTNSATPDLKTCFVASANLGTETAGGQAGRIVGDLMSAPASPGNGIETSATWSTACGNPDVYQVGSSTSATSIVFVGTVTLTGTANLSFFWSQNTSDATAMVVNSGSWMSVQRLN